MKAMYIAGTMPMGISLPIVQLIGLVTDKVQSFVNFFADDDAEDDEKDEDGTIVDDLDDEDDSELFGKDEDKDEDEDEDKSKDKSKDKSAIVQKQKYRGLYKQTKAQLEEALKKLDDKDKAKDENSDPAKAKQEKEARNYLRGLIEEVLGERESKEEAKLRELDEQLGELLEDNDDLTEKQILDVVEELGVTPKQAVAAIRREQRADGKGKKAKPNVPRSKRGGDGDVVDDKTKSKAPSTLEEATAAAKKRLRELNSR